MRKDIGILLEKYNEEEKRLVNKSELARRFNCSRNTINKYLENTIKERRKRSSKSKLDDYKQMVANKVDTYGATAMAVYKFIKEKGYDGSYETVNNFVKQHKKKELKKATIRFETLPGKQAQVDWKENITMTNRKGENLEINIFLMVLGYSRMKFVKITTDRKQKTLFNCLFEGFMYFGGIPQEILFDNMKTVVNREKSTFKKAVLNKTFRYFSQDAGFKVLTCRAYRPQTKGKVESLARLVDRLKVYNEEFDNFDELKRIVEEFNEAINNEISQATKETPLQRHKKEKEYLKPLTPMDTLLSYFHHEKEYKVTKESMINYKGKKYSVPTFYIGKHLTVSENETSIEIYYNNDLVTCHKKTNLYLNYDVEHAYEILQSDALSCYSDDMIEEFIRKNMDKYDVLLKGDTK